MRGRREGWDGDWQSSGRGSEWTVRQEVFKDEDGKARVGLKDGRIVEHLAEIANVDRIFRIQTTLLYSAGSKGNTPAW